MRSHPLLIALAFPLFILAQDKTVEKYASTITAADHKRHLEILASDEYEGRETGKEGQKKAAYYIARHFKSAGLETATDTSYLQVYPLLRTSPEEPKCLVGKAELKNGKDFYVLPYGENIEITATDIVFAGYGISEDVYDDYAGLDVKDKVVLILTGEPIDKDSVSLISGSTKLSVWSRSSRRKVEAAVKAGALALISINAEFDKIASMLQEHLGGGSLKLDRGDKMKTDEEKEVAVQRKRVPTLGISEELANQWFKESGNTCEGIRSKINESKKPVSFSLKKSFSLTLTNKAEKIFSENVLGVVKGSEHPEEVIFVTAHYDHLGVRGGKVFNGADDDGSGTVAVMEMAEAFALAKKAGHGPKRTMVFMTVSGEEKGLLGSSYYTENPIFPLEKTVADLNIDMIGRVDDDHKDSIHYVYIIGSDKISTELHQINEKANADHSKLKLEYKYNDPKDPNRFYYRSDHYNFAEKGVPIIFYFNGVHEDYHEETDEVSKINYDLLTERARLVFYTAWELANRKEFIKRDVEQGKNEK